MKIAVAGLWHLGCVIAAGMARAGHRITGYDPDVNLVDRLNAGKAPLFEPGLDEAIAQGVSAGRLYFTADPASALAGADVLWVAYDTPVDDEDRADTGYVERQVMDLLGAAASPLLVLVSSQLPVGTIARLEREVAKLLPGKKISFASSPENLRLGQALGYFLKPDRILAGVRGSDDRKKLEDLFAVIPAPVEWMSVESAEMAKHAINSFLALSVTFANELAVLCEKVGADARDVERALKTESRIGPKAYVRPGSAFAGGTLARDVVFLSGLSERHGAGIALIPEIIASNESHKRWIYRATEELAGGRSHLVIAVLGLTYKPGTDTLRRSTAFAYALWAAQRGWTVHAHDPRVTALADHRSGQITLCASAVDACKNADVIVIGTPWPEFKSVLVEDIDRVASGAVVLDPDRFVTGAWSAAKNLKFRMVGVKPS